MSHAPRLRTQIQNAASPTTAGRIGAFVVRRGLPHIYLLTSVEAIGWGAVAITSNGKTVAARTGNASNTLDTESSQRLVGWARLSPDLHGLLDPDDFRPIEPVAPREALGQLVFRLADRSKEHPVGRVAKISAVATMEDPSGRHPRTYTQLMEVDVRDAAPHVPFTFGDAGEILALSQGQLAGMVIGLTENSVVLSPLDRVLRAEGFGPVAASLLTQHDPEAGVDVELQRACEETPDAFFSHLETCRDRLYNHFRLVNVKAGREAMEAAQNELAHSVFHAIGFQRFCRELPRLRLRNDAPYTEATDNWLWRALVERLRLVIPSIQGDKLASASAPGQWITVYDEGDVSLWTGKASSPQSVAHRGEIHIDEAVADHYLGANTLKFEEAAA